MDERKIFEDFPTVECNDCEHFWLNQCDGSNEQERVCNAFLATRRVTLPEDVKRLRTRLDLLSGVAVLIVLAQIALLIWR